MQVSGGVSQEAGGAGVHPPTSQGSRRRKGREGRSVCYLEDRAQFQVPDHRNIPRVPGAQGAWGASVKTLHSRHTTPVRTHGQVLVARAQDFLAGSLTALVV